ncbi:MAG: hypothetical protein N2606_07390 [Candidatus Omnitrophica bacterium]|nr:hypothetical protein [Candidatus Omnitrophota bacterium]
MKKVIRSITVVASLLFCIGSVGAEDFHLLNQPPYKNGNNTEIEQSISEWIEESRTQHKNTEEEKTNWFSLFERLKSKAFAVDISEQHKLREDWRDMLGFDMFYPYFKLKDLEDIVKEKTRLNFLNFEGKAEINERSRELHYIFRKKF